MAVEDGAGGPSTPYRSNAIVRIALPSRRTKRLRSPVLPALARPPFLGAALVGVPGIVLGVENEVARREGALVVDALARIENVLAWVFVSTLPLLAFALVRICRTFSASRALKRRYIKRALVLQTTAVAVALWLDWGRSPRPVLPLLADATRADGLRALVYRFPWGCSYDLRVEDGRGMATPVTVVGPFPCDGPLPHVLWTNDDLTIVAANGEVIGTWPTRR